MVKCSESESSYMAGCRCDLCRKAHTDRERGRRAKRRTGRNPDAEETKPKFRPPRPLLYDTLTREELLKIRGYID